MISNLSVAVLNPSCNVCDILVHGARTSCNVVIFLIHGVRTKHGSLLQIWEVARCLSLNVNCKM